MIEIKAWRETDRLKLSAKGHADYNPGNDIVCAAVSTLLCTLAMVSETAVLEPGDACISLLPTTENQAVFRVILSALSAVSGDYGAHVRVEVGDLEFFLQ